METMSSTNDSDVADFFADRSVLITGATGFLGKVLVEKLLRSAPRLKNVYLLIRARKGVDGKQRWKELAETNELFETIRNTKIVINTATATANKKDGVDKNETTTTIVDGGGVGTGTGTLLDKVIVLNGDITERELGLDADDTQLVCDNVSVVFHCAATVKFDERLRLAVQMNVEGTQRLLRLADRMTKLDAFVHASTAYANCDRSQIAEIVYPSPVPWRRLIEGMDWLNDAMFDTLTPALIGARPNTYTFTKAVTESMIVDYEHTNKHLPIVLVRPSIVTAIWRDPMPGWIDNVNGATGLIALGAKGLLRSICGDLHNTRADLIPVDVVANTLIVAAWHRASAKDAPMPIVHCTTGGLNPVLWGQVVYSTINFYSDVMPLVDLFRIPGGCVTTSKFEHRLRMFFDHLLPSYALDLFCKLTGRKAIMVRTYGKIRKVLKTLEYFYTRTWNFDTTGIVSLDERLSESDRKIFYIDVKGIDWTAYLNDYHAGVRKLIFKEAPSTVAAARKIQFRRRVLYNLVVLILVVLFAFVVRRFFFV